MKQLFEVDELQQYCGYGLKICDNFEIHQPTVGDIVALGEDKYFAIVATLTAIPSDMIAQLDSVGLNWQKIEDFELFCMLAPSLPKEETSALFGDVDFGEFQIVPIEGQRRCYLHHKTLNFDIDELRYKAICNYLCNMHGIKKKPRFAGNEFTHKMMIEDAYEDLKRAKNKPHKSSLRPLISTMVNMSGFKYNLKEVMSIGFNEFMDAVSRIQIITSTQALLNGCYTGNIDTKKLDKNELNYMREIGSK